MIGIVTTWMEADIIEANVRNAFAQGCDRVYLIDNDSPDETVARAEAAGATLWCRFSTPQYDEHLKYAIIRDLVARVSNESDSDVWWLFLDADEFPHTTDGRPIRELLDEVDAAARTVGALYLNHYPTEEPHYVVGADPRAFQPMAEVIAPTTFCGRRHRKHTLILNGPGRPMIQPGLGFHSVESSLRPVREADEQILLHHFPYRRRGDTRSRLMALYADADDGPRATDDENTTAHMRERFENMDSVYAGDWGSVLTPLAGADAAPVELRDWRELVAEHFPDIRPR